MKSWRKQTKNPTHPYSLLLKLSELDQAVEPLLAEEADTRYAGLGYLADLKGCIVNSFNKSGEMNPGEANYQRMAEKLTDWIDQQNTGLMRDEIATKVALYTKLQMYQERARSDHAGRFAAILREERAKAAKRSRG